MLGPPVVLLRPRVGLSEKVEPVLLDAGDVSVSAVELCGEVAGSIEPVVEAVSVLWWVGRVGGLELKYELVAEFILL